MHHKHAYIIRTSVDHNPPPPPLKFCLFIKIFSPTTPHTHKIKAFGCHSWLHLPSEPAPGHLCATQVLGVKTSWGMSNPQEVVHVSQVKVWVPKVLDLHLLYTRCGKLSRVYTRYPLMLQLPQLASGHRVPILTAGVLLLLLCNGLRCLGNEYC